MNNPIEPCGACGHLIQLEHDTHFVTTALGVVIHTYCTPNKGTR